MSEKAILLFIGPKGSGKTHLCRALETKLSIPFIPVEQIWLELTQEEIPHSADFHREGLRRVYSRITQVLQAKNHVSLESTGTAPWFNTFLLNLQNIGNIKLIRMQSPMQLCEERVRARDAKVHLPVTEDQLLLINDLASKVELSWDLELYNLASTPVDELVDQVHKTFFK